MSLKIKKITAVIMLAVIFIGTPLVEVKRAEANALTMPLILKGATGAVAGLSVGGAICLLLATVAVAYGVSWVIDNADDIARRFDRWANRKNDTHSKLLLQEIKENAYSISDNGPIPSYNKINSYFDYVTTKSDIMLTPSAKNSIKNFIVESTGATDLLPGTYNNNIGQVLIDKVKYILDDYNYNVNADDDPDYEPWKDNIMQATNAYKYTFLVKGYYIGMNAWYIICTNELPNIFIDKETNPGETNPRIAFNNRFQLKFAYNYINGKLVFYFINDGYMTNAVDFIADNNTFTTVDLLFTDDAGNVVLDLPSAINPPVTIEKSKVKINVPTEEFMNQTNKIAINNKYLQEVMDGVDAKGIPIETIMALVGEAEKEAEKENDIVTDIPIDVPPDIPGETDIEKTLPGILGDWLDKLINKLKELFEWLFVPDSMAIETVISDMMRYIDSQTGVLTYPLALIIRLLNQFMTISKTEAILNLPELRMPSGELLIQGQSFNFNEFIRNNVRLNDLYNIYQNLVKVLVTLYFCNFAIKKGDEVFKGGISR